MRVGDLVQRLNVGEAQVRATLERILGRRPRDGEVFGKDVVARMDTLLGPQDVDSRLLQAAYADVKPLGAPPKQKGTGSRTAALTDRPPVVLPPSATPPRPAAPKPQGQPPIVELRTAERDEAIRERDAANRALAAARQERDDAIRERDVARAALAERMASVGSVMEAFAARGLRGEDEVAMALRGLLDARREGALLKLLRVEEPAALQTFLDERLILVAEGESAPSGVVSVRVPPARSESVSAPATKAAAGRASTALLVRGWKRLLIVGAPPALSRRLREALDTRIQLTFSPEPRLFPADLTVRFGPGPTTPGMVVIDGRSFAEQLAALADHVSKA